MFPLRKVGTDDPRYGLWLAKRPVPVTRSGGRRERPAFAKLGVSNREELGCYLKG